MRNPFWSWRRLKEGRQVFKAEVVITHADGTKVTVTVSGAHANYVSAVANGIRSKYSNQKPKSPALEDVWSLFDGLKKGL